MDHRDGPPRASKRWSPWVICFASCGLLVVLLSIILIGGAALLVHRTTSRIAAEMSRIRDAGEPTDATELNEHYQLPPGVEDTTELWLNATRPLCSEAFRELAAELPIVGHDEYEIPPPGEPWGDLEAAEQLLREYDASLRTLYKAAEIDGAARYPIDLAYGYHARLDHIDPLRAGTRFLRLEAQVRPHRGNPLDAARSIRTIFAMARSLEREPTNVSFLVRLACDATARNQIKALLPTVDFSEADLTGLQDRVRTIDYHDGLRQAILGERAMGVSAFENPDSTVEEIASTPFWHFTQGRGFVFYLDHMDRFFAAAQRPWPQALEDAGQAQAEFDDFFDDASALTRATHVFPALKDQPAMVFEATGRNAAWNDEADAAVAVELYRRRHGKLPLLLKDLVPDFLPQIPTDPYDGKPLKYRVREEEYLIYSVGADRVDDGGTADPANADVEPDLVFRVLRQ